MSVVAIAPHKYPAQEVATRLLGIDVQVGRTGAITPPIGELAEVTVTLASLPAGDAWPFIGRDMFSCCQEEGAGLFQIQMIHFGASYKAVEYEWALWVAEFEALLARILGRPVANAAVDQRFRFHAKTPEKPGCLLTQAPATGKERRGNCQPPNQRLHRL
jgi:hypothetical protein